MHVLEADDNLDSSSEPNENSDSPSPRIGRGGGGVRASELRPIQIIDAGAGRMLDLRVEVPVEDMAKLGEIQEIPSGPASQGDTRTSIWPAIHPLILDLIKQHRSTLIFVNSRRLAERLAAALNELAGEEIVHAHHGSIAREQRMMIEDELKSGRLPAMVATSSLELGIDMGAIDLVIQVEAPPSVSSALQRIGRAGHHVGGLSKGVILPKYRGDLLACAALTDRMIQGAVEQMRYPRNPLDVLAQQIVAMVAMEDWRVDDLERVIRRSAPFAELPRTMFIEVLDMLSGRYPSDDFAELRPRITWDRINNTLHSREGAKRIAITNGGTIPDRGLYGVFLLGAEKGKGRVGELDEEMVFESKTGDVFLLGASSWRIEEITHDRVIVSPAPGVPGKMPFWHGESAGRPLEFGRAIGALTRTLRALSDEDATELLIKKHMLDALAAKNLIQYLRDQEEAAGAVPDDKTIVIESYKDDMGDWRVCILSPFGSKVHAPWAMAIGAIVREMTDYEIDVLWTDDGIVVRFPEADEPPSAETVLPDPEEIEDLVVRQLGAGGAARQAGQGAPAVALFASRFRENAARALLLPRKFPGQRAPLWQQRKRSAELLQATIKYGGFPIILETYRECLRDVFDMPALQELLSDIRTRAVRVVTVTTRTPSPFASALMFNYVANFIYEGDAPLAERRAQALSVDPSQLRELLGEIELRELLDSNSLTELELYLAHLTPERAARHADGLNDLFIRLGDLSRAEIEARVTDKALVDPWLTQLERDRRVIPIPIAGETRWIAAEDAGKYRDALGIPPLSGLPEAFLEYTRDPLGDLVSRYSRTHGPFQTADIARRYAIGVAPVAAILNRMASSGKIVEGEFRPGGTGEEWCDSGVLRALRQKSLARLRHEVEPVDQSALGRLYVQWQGAAEPKRGPNATFQAISQLQGSSIPVSILETQILPIRIADYDSRALDELMTSGAIFWIGCESLGQHDGRISFYLADDAPYLLGGQPASEDRPSSEMHDKIRAHLAARGASFFPQLLQAVGSFPPDVLAALWDLVWAGEVTNDSLHALRAYAHPHRAGRPQRQERAQRPGRGYAGTGRALRPGSRLGASAGSVATPAEASGRWSLVSSLIYDDPTPTERLAAHTNLLLDRYGLVTREAVQAEGIPGGFSSVYGVLKAMEDAGAVRRGYFVAGLGATQFALPGAVDRLRGLRESEDQPQTVFLSAVDPAQPYGGALPWPEVTEGRKPMRIAGAVVILVDGALAAWLPKSERQMTTFLDNVPERDPSTVALEIARALAAEVGNGRRRAVLIEEVNGAHPRETSMAAAFIEEGYVASAQGYLKRV
ncbi:MAG: associated domain protein [Capsulimonas sp.]|nr:associated domain protein [Capsulimonas sp.]